MKLKLTFAIFALLTPPCFGVSAFTEIPSHTSNLGVTSLSAFGTDSAILGVSTIQVSAWSEDDFLDKLVAEVVTGASDVNFYTATNPTGRIRGQVHVNTAH